MKRWISLALAMLFLGGTAAAQSDVISDSLQPKPYIPIPITDLIFDNGNPATGKLAEVKWVVPADNAPDEPGTYLVVIHLVRCDASGIVNSNWTLGELDSGRRIHFITNRPNRDRLLVVSVLTGSDPNVPRALSGRMYYEVAAAHHTDANIKNVKLLFGALLGVPLEEVKELTGSSSVLISTLSASRGDVKQKVDWTVLASVEKPSAALATALGQKTTDTRGCRDLRGNPFPCQISRTFAATESEWWDLGIDVATESDGVPVYALKAQPSPATGNSITQDLKRYNGLAVTLDLKPFFAAPHGDMWPYLQVGLPIKGQPLNRLMLTGAVPVNRLLHLPAGWTNFSIFGGVAIVKAPHLLNTGVGGVTTATDINDVIGYSRTVKGVWGFEVPLKSLVSKLTGIAK